VYIKVFNMDDHMNKSVVDHDHIWDDDGLREGPISEHMRNEITKLNFIVREADHSLINLAQVTQGLNSRIEELCSGYPRRLHREAVLACREVEMARAQLSRAAAQIYALGAEMQMHEG
jgi:hypothetical protein